MLGCATQTLRVRVDPSERGDTAREHHAAEALWLLLLSLGLGTACVDRAPGTQTGDAGPGGGAAATTATLEVRVVDPTTGLALASMPVAIDLRDGSRIELSTDATGHARATLELDQVEGVITHRNNRSFSAASPARILRDAAGDGFVELYSFTLVGLFHGENETAVAGSIVNASSAESRILVTQTGHGLVLDEPGATSYTTTSPAEEPFSLVALEWRPVSETETTHEESHLGWVVASHPGVVVPTVIDLDFGASMAATSLSGRVASPPSVLLSEQARLSIHVLSGPELDRSAWLGLASSTAPNAEKTAYDFVVDHVDLPGGEPVTHYRLSARGGGYSYVFREGLPSAGTSDVGFLVPPHRTAPAGAGPHAWSTPIAWTIDPAHEGEVVVTYTVEGLAIGWGLVAPGETRFTMPALPSASSFLVNGAIRAGVEVSERDGPGAPPRRAARDAEFELSSPLAE